MKTMPTKVQLPTDYIDKLTEMYAQEHELRSEADGVVPPDVVVQMMVRAHIDGRTAMLKDVLLKLTPEGELGELDELPEKQSSIATAMVASGALPEIDAGALEHSVDHSYAKSIGVDMKSGCTCSTARSLKPLRDLSCPLHGMKFIEGKRDDQGNPIDPKTGVAVDMSTYAEVPPTEGELRVTVEGTPNPSCEKCRGLGKLTMPGTEGAIYVCDCIRVAKVHGKLNIPGNLNINGMSPAQLEALLTSCTCTRRDNVPRFGHAAVCPVAKATMCAPPPPLSHVSVDEVKEYVGVDMGVGPRCKCDARPGEYHEDDCPISLAVGAVRKGQVSPPDEVDPAPIEVRPSIAQALCTCTLNNPLSDCPVHGGDVAGPYDAPEDRGHQLCTCPPGSTGDNQSCMVHRPRVSP